MPDTPSFRPLHLALDLDRCIEEAFAELIHEPWGRAIDPAVWQPAIDVTETDDAYLIEADMPGVSPECVEVRVDGRRLTIAGTRDTLTWSRSQSGRNVLVERRHGRFRRTLELDQAIDMAGLETHFEKGILRARLPKKNEGRARPEKSPAQ